MHLSPPVALAAIRSGVVALLFCLFVYCYCDCSMICCALLYVHSSIAIILMMEEMGKRELVALLNFSS